MPSGSYGSLVFQKADIAKEAITKEAKLKISRLYAEWANDIGKKAEYYKNKTTKSSWLQEMNMRQLQGQLQEQSLQVANEVKGIVEDSIYKVADSVVQANSNWLKDLGFPANGVDSAFVSIPDQTVRRLVTGQIYDTGWSLSKSIWGDNEKTLSKLYEIVAQGLAQNMSVYDVSKILEAYVNPNRAKQWNLKMPDGTRIYKRSVDYNAQRLARTLAQHGYQTSFIAVTEKNPFVTDYIWRANGSRVCELCMQRDGMHFKKNELPLDHPNGMCTMEPNVDDDKMVDQLADWINSPDGTFPEIDEFAKQFGYVPENKVSVQANNNEQKINNTHYVAQGKDITNTWNRRPERFDFEIEDVINAQGFDGLPRVVSANEFDKYVKESSFIAQRAYSAPNQEMLDAYRNELYNGKWYVDCSIGGPRHGQGMYCVANYTGNITEGMQGEMKGYSSMYGIRPSYVETFTVDKSANFVDENVIRASMQEYNSNVLKKSYEDAIGETLKPENISQMIDKYKKYFNVEMTTNEMATYLEGMQYKNAGMQSYSGNLKKQTQQIIKKYKLKDHSLVESQFRGTAAYKNASSKQYQDVGSFATSKGYDGIKVSDRSKEEEPYLVILNRTKCIFKGE